MAYGLAVSSSADRHCLDNDRATAGLCARSDVTSGCGKFLDGLWIDVAGRRRGL